MSTSDVRAERVIDARPEIVAQAISSPVALPAWYCDEARIEKRPGGRLLLWWGDGRLAVGRWQAFEPPRILAWRLEDDAGGQSVALSFELQAEVDSTRLTVTQADVPQDQAGGIRQQLATLLEDLKVVVETGRNSRLLRRPMLGVNIEPVTAESAKKHGLEVDHGILVTGIMPGSGAEIAGLQRGDVLLAISQSPLSDWTSISGALAEFSAGDTVTVRLLRGAKTYEFAVTLQGRPTPEAPAGRAAIADGLRHATTRWIAALEAELAIVTEDEAARSPAEGEWNIKEVLVHLSFVERFGQDWLTRAASDSPLAPWPNDPDPLWQSALAAMPLDRLMARVSSDLRDSLELSLAVLERDPPPWLERSIAEGIALTDEHIEDHLNQIRKNLGRA